MTATDVAITLANELGTVRISVLIYVLTVTNGTCGEHGFALLPSDGGCIGADRPDAQKDGNDH